MAQLSRTQVFSLETYRMCVEPGPARRILDGLRALYGGCVVTPSSAGADPGDQPHDLRRR